MTIISRRSASNPYIGRVWDKIRGVPFKKNLINAVIFTFIILYQSLSFAVPVGTISMNYTSNSDSTYTYNMSIENHGPTSGLTTPSGYSITDSSTTPPTVYPAGDKSLDDDEDFYYFGLDTGSDDVIITNITGSGGYWGNEQAGWGDEDLDGINNKVVAWYFPYSWWGPTTDEPLAPGELLSGFSFTLDTEISVFSYWIGGSDDVIKWGPSSYLSFYDDYGTFDTGYNLLTDTQDYEGKYVDTIQTGQLTVSSVPEPTTFFFMLSGLIGIICYRKKISR